MFSIAQTFCLKPGCYAEYKQAHDDLWPEIDLSMAIFLHGERLFLHAVAPTQADWDRSREHPALERWHAYMATLMVTDTENQTIVEELPAAFTFGIFR